MGLIFARYFAFVTILIWGRGGDRSYKFFSDSLNMSRRDQVVRSHSLYVGIEEGFGLDGGFLLLVSITQYECIKGKASYSDNTLLQELFNNF